MAKHIKDLSINPKTNKVTMRFVERDSWGSIQSRQQITVSKREFEAALRAAEITVPWQDVVRS